MCSLVIITTAHDCNVTNHHIVEQVPGDCIETQEALKFHHPIKSSGPGNGCPSYGQHPESKQPIANNWQYGDPR